MLLSPRVLRGVEEGTIDLAFRRWERPRVKAGGHQRTAIGVIGFESVEEVEPAALTTDDARRAGFASRDALVAFLSRRMIGSVYRVRLRLVGPDPRVALRESLPSEAEVAGIAGRLARLDEASRHGAWTREVLETIRDRPGVPAAELAAHFGRPKLPFKVDVRKLKELGLTESLRPGYRLSARGEAFLERIGDPADR